MKKLLSILLFVSTVLSTFGQAGSLAEFNWSSPGGQRVGLRWLPPNYNANLKYRTYIFFPGAGERSATVMNYSAGMPKYLQDGSFRPDDAIVLCYQIANGTVFPDGQYGYTDAVLDAIWTHATANFKIDFDKVVPTGLSLGGIGVSSWVNKNPSYFSSYLIVSATVGNSTAFYNTIQDIPGFFVHNKDDNTQNMVPTVVTRIDSLLKRNRSIPIRTDFRNTGGHTGWDPYVYGVFNKWHAQLRLMDRRKDSTARNHVDSLERSNDENFFWRTKRIVDDLSASAFKTGLQSRVDAVYDIIQGTGYKRILIDFKTTTGNDVTGNIVQVRNAATGTAYSNMVTDQGVGSGITMTIVNQTHPTTGSLYRSDGLQYPLWDGMPALSFVDGMNVSGNLGVLRFSGLNNGKTYRAKFTSNYKTYANTNEGLIITTGGVSKQINFAYYNTERFIEFDNLVPSGGIINFNTAPFSSGALGTINTITFTEEGTAGTPNVPPTVNVGSDIEITLPTKTGNLTSTRADSDGSIVSELWERLSGPAITFGTPTAQNTTFTASTFGNYVVKKTVYDNSGASASATMNITINDSIHPPPTANDTLYTFRSPKRVAGPNLGFYNFVLSEIQQIKIAWIFGSTAIRSSLYYYELAGSGYAAQHPRNDTLNALGMNQNVFFVQAGPPSLAFPGNRIEKITYPGYPYSSQAFEAMDSAIWIDDERSDVNPDNPAAVYIKNTVLGFGRDIAIISPVNEIDVPFGSPQAEWFNLTPNGANLVNWQAPAWKYNRFLRIVFEVTKKYRPDIGVGPGGLGYPSFLHWLCRSTDNPDSGKVSAQYPLTAAAYFDVMDIHVYPMYGANVYDPSKPFNRRYQINSDQQANYIREKMDSMQAILNLFGYNGVTKPKKYFALTEVNVARVPWSQSIGSLPRLNFNETHQTNFLIKAFVSQHKNDIKMMNTYLIAEQLEESNYPNGTDENGQYGFMGFIENGNRAGTNLTNYVVRQQAYVYKTWNTLFKDYDYDSTLTSAMAMPSGVDGACFRKGTDKRFVVWAKTLGNDSSEVASATYTLPSSFSIGSAYKYQWDYSQTNTRSKITTTGMTLTGQPIFLSSAPNDVDEPLFLGAIDKGSSFDLTFMPNRATTTNGYFVVAGSSSTAGTGATTYDSSVVPRLAAKWTSGMKAHNISVGGQTGVEITFGSGNISSRDLQTIVVSRPAFVMLAYPSNWIPGGFSDAQYLSWMRYAWNYLRSYGIPAFIVGPQPRDDLASVSQGRLRAVNDSLKIQFDRRFTNLFIDSLRDLTSNLPAARLEKYKASGDLIHLNNLAHKDMADWHYKEIDSFFFDRAEIYLGYRVQNGSTATIGVEPGVWAEFDTITNANTTRKNYARLGNGVYAFRYQAQKIDGSWTDWSNVVYIQQKHARLNIDQAIKVNLGLTADADAPAPWNEVSTASGATTAGLVFSNLVDSLSQPTGVNLTVINAFSSVGVTGVASSLGSFPASVGLSGWQNSATVNTVKGTIRLSGLTEGAYQLVCYGSKNNTTTLPRRLGIVANGNMGSAAIHNGSAAGNTPFVVDGIIVNADGLMTIDAQSVGDLTNFTGFILRRYTNTINVSKYLPYRLNKYSKFRKI